MIRESGAKNALPHLYLSRKRKGEGWPSSSLSVPSKEKRGKGNGYLTSFFLFLSGEGRDEVGRAFLLLYISLSLSLYRTRGREEGVNLPRTPISLTFNFKVTNET